ncbi:hypothetical protein FOZ62_004970, partial [Perkinsus olseni]
KASQEPRPEVEATPEPLRRANQCEERPSSLKRKTIAKAPGGDSSAKRPRLAHKRSEAAVAAQSSNFIADGFYVVRISAAFCHLSIATDAQSGSRHGFVQLNNGTSKDVTLSGFEWVEDHRVQEVGCLRPMLLDFGQPSLPSEIKFRDRVLSISLDSIRICPGGPKKLKLIFLDENGRYKCHAPLERTS